jgi:hypothetical protein
MKYLTPLLLFVAVTFPQIIFAQEGVVTCKEGGECNFCDFTDMVQRINIWLLIIVGLIAVILFIYAGYRITASRGDVSVVTDARKMIGNVAIGIFIMILATTIVDVIMQTATGKDFGVWNRPTDCGSQGPNRGLNTDSIEMGAHDSVTVPADSTASGGIGATAPGAAGDGLRGPDTNPTNPTNPTNSPSIYTPEMDEDDCRSGFYLNSARTACVADYVAEEYGPQ